MKPMISDVCKIVFLCTSLVRKLIHVCWHWKMIYLHCVYIGNTLKRTTPGNPHSSFVRRLQLTLSSGALTGPEHVGSITALLEQAVMSGQHCDHLWLCEGLKAVVLMVDGGCGLGLAPDPRLVPFEQL